MHYYRTQNYYDSSGWRGTWAMDGGGALMNQGIHGVDALNSIMNGVETVTGTIKTLLRDIEVEDTAAAVLSFKNGALGTIEASVAAYPGYPRKITINGELGCVVLTEQNVTFCDVSGFGEVIPVQSIHSGSSDPSNTPTYGHAMQLADLIQAVKTGGRTRSDIRDGCDTVKIIESIYKSSQNGMRILL
jgi:predicted dehydrogenase